MTRLRMGLVAGGSALLFTFVGPFLYKASGLDNPVGNCSPVGSNSPVGMNSKVDRHGDMDGHRWRHHHHPVGSESPVGSSSPVGSCSPLGNLASTRIGVDLSGGGQYGHSITVGPSDLVNAQATLSGDDVASAGGTVTYAILSLSPDHWSWSQVGTPDTVTVTGGVVPGSSQVALGPGVYTWTATYSGDTANAPSHSSEHADVEFVVSADCPSDVGWLSVRCFAGNGGYGNGSDHGNSGNSGGNGSGNADNDGDNGSGYNSGGGDNDSDNGGNSGGNGYSHGDNGSSHGDNGGNGYWRGNGGNSGNSGSRSQGGSGWQGQDH